MKLDDYKHLCPDIDTRRYIEINLLQSELMHFYKQLLKVFHRRQDVLEELQNDNNVLLIISHWVASECNCVSERHRKRLFLELSPVLRPEVEIIAKVCDVSLLELVGLIKYYNIHHSQSKLNVYGAVVGDDLVIQLEYVGIQLHAPRKKSFNDFKLIEPREEEIANEASLKQIQAETFMILNGTLTPRSYGHYKSIQLQLAHLDTDMFENVVITLPFYMMREPVREMVGSKGHELTVSLEKDEHLFDLMSSMLTEVTEPYVEFLESLDETEEVDILNMVVCEVTQTITLNLGMKCLGTTPTI